MIPFFTKEELLSPDGLALLERGINPMDDRTLFYLSELRKTLDTPVLVNHSDLTLRGWRSPQENEGIYLGKGVSPANRMSSHIAGKAVDISVPGMSIQSLLDTIRGRDGWKGVGIYTWGLHIDTWGDSPRTWNG